MMIGARTGAWSPRGAPLPYDAEVEWLESLGDQYVITDCIPTNIDRIVTTFVQFVKNADGNNIFCSKTGLWDAKPNYWLFLKSDSSYQIWAFSNFQILNLTTLYERKMVCDLNMQEHLISVHEESADPKYKSINVGTEAENQNPVQLFPDGHGTNARTRIFILDVFRNGVKIAEYIPVRFTNENGISEGAMYDRISGQLFRNQGTGAFVIGPDKT